MEEERRKILSRNRVRKHREIEAEIDDVIAKRSRFHERIRRTEPRDVNSSEPIHEPEASGNSQTMVVQNPCGQVLQESREPEEFYREDDRAKSPQSTSSLEHGVINVSAGEVIDHARISHESDSSTATESDVNIVAPRIDAVENDEIIQIRRWAVSRNIRQNALDELLEILRRRVLPQLPKSAKTFLQTGTAAYNIRQMEAADNSMGQFVYFGIAKGLEACVLQDLHTNNKLSLQINVDGVKMFNSGSKQFWPILCKVFFSPDIYKPFVVGLYSGDAKPMNARQFLHDFIQEMNELTAEGILLGERHLEIEIHSFICDTPARAFLKGVKPHGSYFGCERCEVEGERAHNRTVYPDVDARERNDHSFRLKAQPQHHKYDSPLLALECHIDMVRQFSLDYMHLCCEGIMKKLLCIWAGCKRENFMRRRLRNCQQQEISRLLMELRRCIPLEFQRRPRSLRFLNDWKATEFRFFLLYCGPIVLKGILDPELYRHFLLLHVACRILCSNELALSHVGFAKTYLKSFFRAMAIIYGRQSQIMNAHNLIHLADDVRNMNCTLDAMSAFPFESLLGRLKTLLRNPNRPMAQVCRRLHELETVATKPRVPSHIRILKSKMNHNNDQLEIQKIRYKGFTLSTTFPNNLVLLRSGLILKITKMHCSPINQRNIRISGNQWKQKRSIFTRPTESADLKSFQLLSRSCTRDVGCGIQSIEQKMVQLEIKPNFGRGETKFFAIALLHQ